MNAGPAPTAVPDAGPGAEVDPSSGLRAWNGHLAFVGHLDQADATHRVLTFRPDAASRFDLGPAFHEYVHPVLLGGAWQWLFCRADADGALPVTVLIPHRLDEDHDHDCH